ncbi:uncharacterized protein LOC119722739 [Patiria miniata]|uniref:Uncharacterized protein n=1 Tax=Patiria miniata TaxID=46514 RepID=A0A913ZBM0_PATMI|nr:uncharacterized protein LOC119722739 [Patiria miniata]
MRGLGTFLVALAISSPSALAHTCYFGQEAESEPGPGGYTQYQWVLQGEASLDPCGCTAFQLGGVNTVTFGGGVRSFNVSELSKTPEEIRRTLDCQQGLDAAEDSTLITNNGDPIRFPFEPFTTFVLRSTFELNTVDQSGKAHFYLATNTPATQTNRPPYMIEFMAARMNIRKLDASTSIYEMLASETIPSDAAAIRRFRVLYKYLIGDQDTPTVLIEVIFEMDGGGQSSSFASVSDGKLVHYVGISSTVRTQWKFLDP